VTAMSSASSLFDERLAEAHAAGDLARCLGLLRVADFALPLSDAAAAGAEPAAWPAMTAMERTWLMAYTSAEVLDRAMGRTGHRFRVVSLAELCAGWPDPSWGLAVNPGMEVSFLLEPGTVARLGVPTLAQDHAAEPGSGPPIVQKLLHPDEIHALLDADGPTVSGYCHHALDVAHIATPTVLADALMRDEAISAGGAVNILRWPAIGLALYRTPYGGVDEEGRAAVEGWVIEEPPFIGMGLVPNIDQTIREYKVDGIGLPHGAEIVELAADGVERRRAVYDGDLGRWLLTDDETPEVT
jgi:SseB protein N-terminal domain